MSSDGNGNGNSPELTAEQIARIERNRQRALLLRHERRAQLTTKELIQLEVPISSNAKDSGGGFLIEDDSDDERFKSNYTLNREANQVSDEPIECEECHSTFTVSFLRTYFTCKICDNCKDLRDRHSLITRTDAKTEFLLKDCDFDLREPPLRFITKKNPHHNARGEMKLYLRFQVKERALEVWECEENLDVEMKMRNDKRCKRKQKQYNKKMDHLRMAVRSSLFKKTSKVHVHEYGDEKYNDDADEYEKTCKTCGHSISYEKM